MLDNTPPPTNDSNKEYEYLIAYCGFIGYCAEADKKAVGKKYLIRAMTLTDGLLERHPDDPRFLALKGSLYGLKMGFTNRLAPILGPKAEKNINRALEIDPGTPQALVEMGNKFWNMPKLMGGSHSKAIAEYEKAIRLMDNDEEFRRENWYYLNVMVTLAKWYEEEGRISQTKRICRKLLEIEPDFRWPQEKLKSFDL